MILGTEVKGKIFDHQRFCLPSSASANKFFNDFLTEGVMIYNETYFNITPSKTSPNFQYKILLIFRHLYGTKFFLYFYTILLSDLEHLEHFYKGYMCFF